MHDRPDILLVSEEDGVFDDHFDAWKNHISAPLSAKRVPSQSRRRLIPHGQHLSVVALGTYLKQHGIRPVVIDNILHIPQNLAQFRRVLSDGVPVVGISTTLLLESAPIDEIVNEIRTYNPSAKILLGGITAEQQPEVTALGDIVIKGAGERTLLTVLMAMKAGAPLDRIPNLLLRQGDFTRDTGSYSNISPNDIPPPDWDLLEIRPSLCYPVEASKGCRYKCAFCSYPNLADQSLKDPNLVVAELLRNREKYGIRLFRFVDSNLTSWPEQTEKLCDLMIERRLDVEWSCYARVDNLARRPGLAAKMHQAGCVAVYFGIESGDDSILRAMRKGYDSTAILEGVRLAKEAGLIVHGNFIIGFPGETSDTVDNTLDLVLKARPDTACFSVLWLHRNSEALLWTQKERWNIRGQGTHWAHATMNSDQAKFHVERAMNTVMTDMTETVLGNELHLMWLLGYGLSLDQAMSYFFAARDIGRAKRTGRKDLEAKALARIQKIWSRVESHIARLHKPEFEDMGRKLSARSALRALRSGRRALAGNALLASIFFLASGFCHARIWTQEIGPLELQGEHMPMHGPYITKSIQFNHPVWIRGISVDLLDEKKQVQRDDGVFCHSSIIMPPASPLEHGQRFALSEGLRELVFPEGYGLPMSAHVQYVLESMLQSDSASTDKEYYFRVTMDLADRGTHPLLKGLALYRGFVDPSDPKDNPQIPPSWQQGWEKTYHWWVPPGKHEYVRRFRLPVNGTIHYISFHVHKYATRVRFRKISPGKPGEAMEKVLFSDKITSGDHGRLLKVPVYSSVEGIPVRKDSLYEFAVAYDNVSGAKISGMGIINLFVH